MKISSKDISEYLNSSNKNFKIFDIAYSKDDEKAIDNLQITTYKTYNHYGKLDKMIGLKEFLQIIGSNTETNINKIEKIIKNLISKVLSVYKKDYYWLTIRVSMPDSYFDIPRWHKDGSYAGFTPEDNSSKFLTVLKGPGTLAIKQTKEVDEIYKKTLDAEYDKVNKLIGKKKLTDNEKMDISNKVNEEFRPKFAKAFGKFKVLQPANNQAILFYTKSTLHSEPKMTSPRLFISIMPGTKANIEGLDKAWNKK